MNPLINYRLLTRLACGALASIIAGCGDVPAPEDSAGEKSDRKILRIAYEREIDVLNAYTSQMLVDIQFSMVEGLVTTNEKNSFIPVLAKIIPTEANGMIVRNTDGTVDMTWPLHDNVRWHDGEAFTSEDVCFTWRFVTSTGSQTYNRDQYLGIKECLMPDEHTVVFRWDGIYGYYAGIFEAILPEHVLGEMTTDEIVNYTPFNRGDEFPGTGPFRFAEWKSGEYIRVVRNDDYWRGANFPAIDEIVWSFIPDVNTRLNAMKTGRYDFARIEPTQIAEADTIAGFEVHRVSSNSFMHLDLSLNTDRSRMLFGDPAVRLAMFHAVDRPAIADLLMEGTVKLANSPINPTSAYHSPDVEQPDYDPALAMSMLDELGWTVGTDGIREKDGQRFSFVILNRAGQGDRIAVAQVIQAQLKAVGIEVTFETLENAAWTSRWRNEQWEGVVSAWFMSADPSITSLYLCDGPNNMTGMCDPELDELLVQSDKALDFDTRKRYLDLAQEKLAANATMLPIYYNVIPEVVSNRIGNYRGSGTNFGSFWNLYEWTLAH
jgi:peptide/nickel transport system substrate-binding protein